MPAELVARSYRRALLHGARHNRLGYGDPRGSLVLREAVAEMLKADRGLDCTAENICVTRGSQMGIFLSARLLVQAGDAMAIESLSYPPAREAFRAAGAKILSIEMDDQGMRLEHLEAVCRQQAVRAVYVTPHHHFPDHRGVAAGAADQVAGAGRAVLGLSSWKTTTTMNFTFRTGRCCRLQARMVGENSYISVHCRSCSRRRCGLATWSRQSPSWHGQRLRS